MDLVYRVPNSENIDDGILKRLSVRSNEREMLPIGLENVQMSERVNSKQTKTCPDEPS